MPAAGWASGTAIAQFRAFLADTRNARGEFTQQAIRSSGRAAPRLSGRFAFERPGRFRWQVDRPYEQIIVADGQTLYLYDVDLQQVSLRPVGEALGSTPAALLFGQGDLARDFALAELGELGESGDRKGLVWLEAQPRSREAGFERIQLAFRQGLPVEMQVRDALGQVTQFVFSGIERNRPLDPELFRFTPPPGVDVIR